LLSTEDLKEFGQKNPLFSSNYRTIIIKIINLDILKGLIKKKYKDYSINHGVKLIKS